MNTLLWFVILYWGISVGIGLYAARYVNNSKDFALAGRSLPMSVVTATVFATWFGSEAVLGISSTFLKDGLRGVVADPFGSSLCLVLVGLFFARPLYRMNLLSIGDYYRNKFGRTVETLVTLCIVVSYLGWVAAQIKALGLVFNVVSGGYLPMETGMMIGAASVLIYTLMGGMWSVAITDFLQMIIIVLGMFYIGWEGFLPMREVPKDAIEITAIGSMWKYEFVSMCRCENEIFYFIFTFLYLHNAKFPHYAVLLSTDSFETQIRQGRNDQREFLNQYIGRIQSEPSFFRKTGFLQPKI